MKENIIQLIEVFTRVRHMLKDFTFDIAQNSELTLAQLSVVAVLTEYGDLGVQELAERVSLANSTVSGILDRLEKKQIVQRIRSEKDRRKVAIHLVEGNEKFYLEYKRERDRRLYEKLQKLEEEEIRKMIEGLLLMEKALE